MIFTSTDFHASHLSIQPTGDCAKSCRGCYVKQYDGLGLDSILLEEILLANNFDTYTFSLDTLSRDLEKSLRMQNLYMIYVDNCRQGMSFTVNSYEDFIEYLDLYPITKEVFRLAISSPITQEQYEELTKRLTVKHLIYNFRFSGSVGKGKKLPVYSIMNKPATGEEIDQSSLIMFKDLVAKQDPGDVILDTCYTDSLNSLRTGFSCSAGISKFHLWPDGSISGCPYTQKGTTQPSLTYKDFVQNILQVYHSEGDFARCKIPLALGK